MLSRPDCSAGWLFTYLWYEWLTDPRRNGEGKERASGRNSEREITKNKNKEVPERGGEGGPS